MASSYPSVLDGMMSSNAAPQPSAAAYHQAVKQSMPPISEVDALRQKFGFIPSSNQSQDPFWRALAATLSAQHDASEALQEQGTLGNAAQVGQPNGTGTATQPSGPQPTPQQPSMNSPAPTLPQSGVATPNNPAMGS